MIFYSVPIQNGHSWTITSKLSHIIQTAECNYGERDKTYTILGVEFTNNGNPQIWYPGNCKHIAIQITMNCQNDLNRAVFQVAHEVIHCLSPSGGQNANVLEEGLANLFSIEYCKKFGHGNSWVSSQQEYTDASKKVKQLLEIDKEIIKKIRTIHKTVSINDKTMLLDINPNIPEELAIELTNKF